MTDIDNLIAEARMESGLNEGAEGEYPFERITELLDALEAERQRNAELEWQYRELQATVRPAVDQRDALAAVIEKARVQAEQPHPDYFDNLKAVLDILSTADPASVRREVKAEAWDEGHREGRNHHASIHCAKNPYRGEA